MKLRSRGREIDVPTTMLDRVVSYFSPSAGVGRMRSRATMAIAGAYDGGARDRRPTKRWRPTEGSADADTLSDLPALRGRARDLERNAPIATGAIATVVTNVIGDGLQLQVAVDGEALGLTADQVEQWQYAAAREWALFCCGADFSRVQHWYGLQALVYRTVKVSGDAVIVRRYRKDIGAAYGTKLQVLEGDRLCNPGRAADSDKVAGGVEVDGDGVPVAYWIADRHPGGLRVAGLKWDRVAARTPAGEQVILHLYQRLRPEQSRGMPYLAPVIEHLKQIANYTDAELQAAVVSAYFTVFVKSDAPESTTPTVGETDSTLAANELKMAPAAVLDLDVGESIEIADPKRPNALFDPFVQAMLRQIGVALEIPFELLIKHFTASYSASRAALEMAWQFFQKERAWFAREFCQPVYEWVISEAVASGRLAAPGFFADPLVRRAWCGALWIGPHRVSVDPLKEAKADEIDVALRVKTRETIVMQRVGGNIARTIAQLGKEQRLIDEQGLGVAAAAPSPAVPPPPDDAEDEAATGDDTEDETEDERVG